MGIGGVFNCQKLLQCKVGISCFHGTNHLYRIRVTHWLHLADDVLLDVTRTGGEGLHVMSPGAILSPHESGLFVSLQAMFQID